MFKKNRIKFNSALIFSATPIALINTTKLVEPALMNGSGSPVDGIEPAMTFYCTEKLSSLEVLHAAILSKTFFDTFQTG